MNKKGFAISIILYAIVFLIITILYILLGIEKNRYTVNQKLRESVVEQINGINFSGKEDTVITLSSYNVNVNVGSSETIDYTYNGTLSALTCSSNPYLTCNFNHDTHTITLIAQATYSGSISVFAEEDDTSLYNSPESVIINVTIT